MCVLGQFLTTMISVKKVLSRPIAAVLKSSFSVCFSPELGGDCNYFLINGGVNALRCTPLFCADEYILRARNTNPS